MIKMLYKGRQKFILIFQYNGTDTFKRAYFCTETGKIKKGGG